MWGDKRLSRLAFAAKTVSGGLWLVSVSASLELFLPGLFHLETHHLLLLLLVWHETVFSFALTNTAPSASCLAVVCTQSIPQSYSHNQQTTWR